jgi:hypothetical protein
LRPRRASNGRAGKKSTARAREADATRKKLGKAEKGTPRGTTGASAMSCVAQQDVTCACV